MARTFNGVDESCIAPRQALTASSRFPSTVSASHCRRATSALYGYSSEACLNMARACVMLPATASASPRSSNSTRCGYFGLSLSISSWSAGVRVSAGRAPATPWSCAKAHPAPPPSAAMHAASCAPRCRSALGTLENFDIEPVLRNRAAEHSQSVAEASRACGRGRRCRGGGQGAVQNGQADAPCAVGRVGELTFDGRGVGRAEVRGDVRRAHADR